MALETAVMSFLADTGGGRCPGFDEMMMMPDAKDGNANPDRFFVSLHWIFEN